MIYHVLYLLRCEPRIIKFYQRSSMQAWVFSFLLEHQDSEDNRVEAVFYGQLDYSCYEED